MVFLPVRPSQDIARFIAWGLVQPSESEKVYLQNYTQPSVTMAAFKISLTESNKEFIDFLLRYHPMKINIETENEAFDNPNELPRILLEIVDRINQGETQGIIRDTNGNKVGSWEI